MAAERVASMAARTALLSAATMVEKMAAMRVVWMELWRAVQLAVPLAASSVVRMADRSAAPSAALLAEKRAVEKVGRSAGQLERLSVVMWVA